MCRQRKRRQAINYPLFGVNDLKLLSLFASTVSQLSDFSLASFTFVSDSLLLLTIVVGEQQHLLVFKTSKDNLESTLGKAQYEQKDILFPIIILIEKAQHILCIFHYKSSKVFWVGKERKKKTFVSSYLSRLMHV